MSEVKGSDQLTAGSLAGALTARPLALVAEWLSEQHKTYTEGVRSPPAGHIHIPTGSPAHRVWQGASGLTQSRG